MTNNNNITTDINLAVTQLNAGGLIAFPTETVYGLGADAKNPAAIAKVFSAKGRPADHPVIVHIGDAAKLPVWAADIPESAWILSNAFWPGPLTMILKKHPYVSNLITGGQDTIGIRIPNHPLTLQLLKQFESGIVGPSANKYGRVSPTCAQHVAVDFADTDLVILDGGECEVGIESTIIDMTSAVPTIRRLGAISAQQIQALLGTPVEILIGSNTTVRTPGSHESHYAPRTSCKLLTLPQLLSTANEYVAKGTKFSVLSFVKKPEDLPEDIFWQRTPLLAEDYAHNLYANLRKHDQLNNDVILIERPAADQEWAAILDRLSRACA